MYILSSLVVYYVVHDELNIVILLDSTALSGANKASLGLSLRYTKPALLLRRLYILSLETVQ